MVEDEEDSAGNKTFDVDQAAEGLTETEQNPPVTETVTEAVTEGVTSPEPEKAGSEGVEEEAAAVEEVTKPERSTRSKVKAVEVVESSGQQKTNQKEDQTFCREIGG